MAHRKTTVLRIAPNAVSISDGAALHSIYVARGGYTKSARYENFKVAGTHTIFSSSDTAYRDVRAKVVAPIFAMAGIKAASEDTGVIGRNIDRFIDRLNTTKHEALQRTPHQARIEILDPTYRLTVDTTTGFLFGREYGALDEKSPLSTASTNTGTMSALPLIFAIVKAGCFSLLPNWFFNVITSILHWLCPDHAFEASLACVRDFASSITADANPGKDSTYQARLLAAGISTSETIIQCMAVMFAGTDSTAVKLVTLIFHLVQSPQVHDRLKQEVKLLDANPALDISTLPFLRAVVKEGLRLGIANPARFSRIVPSGEGLEIGGYHIPPGTDVGLSPYVLHHNPDVFPEPWAFRPERWLPDDEQLVVSQLQRMNRDLIPFNIGSRACIARNLATHELLIATKRIVESGVLEGAKTCEERIKVKEYFNLDIEGHKMEIEWVN
ncbi:MAG: hypothetical protein Q9194_002203 [Teloschistes cf. exilis]